MNNKGFTLIELTAVIVVLVAIFLVSFPAILNTTKSDDDKKYDDMKKDLCLAGESYIYKTEYLQININDIIEVPIQELIQYGNVDIKLINPKTNKSVKQDKLIFTVLNDYSLDCQYSEYNES